MKTLGWILLSAGVFAGLDIYKETIDDRSKLIFLIICGGMAFIGFILVLTSIGSDTSATKKVSELLKLKSLLDAELLTKEEFEEQKKKVLE